jgi:hypothetical protein
LESHSGLAQLTEPLEGVSVAGSRSIDREEKHMRNRIIKAVSIVVAVSTASSAFADNSQLKGSFAEEGSVACTSNGASTIGVSSGVYRFDGAGNGTANVTSTDLVPPAAITGRVDFTYRVAADAVTFTAVNQSFQLPGTTTVCTIDQEILTGYLAEKGLTLVSTQPNVETITCSNGAIEQQVCVRNWVLLKM